MRSSISIVALLALALLSLASCSGGGDGGGGGGGRTAPPDLPPAGDALVLYDDVAPYGWLGETYAIAAGHLASRFGTWHALPVREYRAGELRRWRAAVYVGSAEGAPIPAAFLDDVLAGGTPVLWLAANVQALEQRQAGFAARFGFVTGSADEGPFPTVLYKGQALTGSGAAEHAGGIRACAVVDGAKAAVLATALRFDGLELPWAIRSGDLTYVAENPLADLGESDRYLAFADLLFDALAPDTPERHRALVRIDDVTPVEDPARLRGIADLLHGLGVPFSVAVVPVWVDPLGAYSADGLPLALQLRYSPEVVAALAYMVERGGEIVLHGYTHQYQYEQNPYSGASGDDLEFWTAQVDEADRVIYGGPIPLDSESYARDRVNLGLEELAAAGLPPPIAFEYPHDAGSAVDSRAISAIVPTAYHRGMYFPGTLSGGGEDLTRLFGQLFPYVVTDVYGWRVIPENLGSYEDQPWNGDPPRLVEDLLRNAEANRVVRDGFASFFLHPQLEPEILASIVTGIRQRGYEFVSPASL